MKPAKVAWVEYWIRYPELSLRAVQLIRQRRVSRKHNVPFLSAREEFAALIDRMGAGAADDHELR